jgi:hypothetical protein
VVPKSIPILITHSFYGAALLGAKRRDSIAMSAYLGMGMKECPVEPGVMRNKL